MIESRLPGTMTSRPTRLAPCSTCICMNCPDSACTVAFSFSMPLTVLICAIWLVTCALSIGLSGSWFCICATSSLRKRSALAVAESTLALALSGSTAAVAGRAEETVMTSLLRWDACAAPRSRLAHLQRLLQQALGRVHDLDVVLVRARRRD